MSKVESLDRTMEDGHPETFPNLEHCKLQSLVNVSDWTMMTSQNQRENSEKILVSKMTKSATKKWLLIEDGNDDAIIDI